QHAGGHQRMEAQPQRAYFKSPGTDHGVKHKSPSIRHYTRQPPSKATGEEMGTKKWGRRQEMGTEARNGDGGNFQWKKLPPSPFLPWKLPPSPFLASVPISSSPFLGYPRFRNEPQENRSDNNE